MRVFVTTCDSHRHLLRGFSKLFNLFWGKGQKVEVLGFSLPNEPLPSNFDFVSLGRQKDFPAGVWTDPLIPFMQEVTDDYFVLLLEDEFLLGPVDHFRLQESEDLARKLRPDKVLLYSRPQHRRSRLSDKWDLLEDRSYRTSLCPAIWKKDYFMRYLTPGISVWAFDNHRLSQKDGSTIVIPRSGAVYPFADVYNGGEFSRSFRQIMKPGVRFGDSDWQLLTHEAYDEMETYL
jgi:hypothetical protein